MNTALLELSALCLVPLVVGLVIFGQPVKKAAAKKKVWTKADKAAFAYHNPTTATGRAWRRERDARKETK